MKKQTLMKIFLVLMPVLAVGLATTKDSVLVYHPTWCMMQAYSYFDLLPVGVLQSVTPLAAVLCVLVGGFAIGFVITGKKWCINAVKIIAFSAACLAVLPVLLPSDTKVLPNVGVPIFMMVEFVLAHIMGKMEPGKTKKQGPRLSAR